MLCSYDADPCRADLGQSICDGRGRPSKWPELMAMRAVHLAATRAARVTKKNAVPGMKFDFLVGLHILAAVSEEARMISALAAAKARGVKLGGKRGGAGDLRPYAKAGSAAAAAVRAAVKADARAQDLAPIIEEMKAAGSVSLRELADGLNARGISAARGGAVERGAGGEGFGAGVSPRSSRCESCVRVSAFTDAFTIQ